MLNEVSHNFLLPNFNNPKMGILNLMPQNLKLFLLDGSKLHKMFKILIDMEFCWMNALGAYRSIRKNTLEAVN